MGRRKKYENTRAKLANFGLKRTLKRKQERLAKITAELLDPSLALLDRNELEAKRESLLTFLNSHVDASGTAESITQPIVEEEIHHQSPAEGIEEPVISCCDAESNSLTGHSDDDFELSFDDFAKGADKDEEMLTDHQHVVGLLHVSPKKGFNTSRLHAGEDSDDEIAAHNRAFYAPTRDTMAIDKFTCPEMAGVLYAYKFQAGLSDVQFEKLCYVLNSADSRRSKTNDQLPESHFRYKKFVEQNLPFKPQHVFFCPTHPQIIHKTESIASVKDVVCPVESCTFAWNPREEARGKFMYVPLKPQLESYLRQPRFAQANRLFRGFVFGKPKGKCHEDVTEYDLCLASYCDATPKGAMTILPILLWFTTLPAALRNLFPIVSALYAGAYLFCLNMY